MTDRLAGIKTLAKKATVWTWQKYFVFADFRYLLSEVDRLEADNERLYVMVAKHEEPHHE